MKYEEQLKKLYHDPVLYEQEYASLNADVDFWVNYVKNNNINSLLELGCGSGRIGMKVIPLLREYAGIDLSTEFLSEFERRLQAQANNNVCIEKCDMANFSLSKKFDLIILPFNTISHLYALEQVTNMLSCVRNHMKADSRFIIDCFNPNMKFLATHTERRLCNEFTMSLTGDNISVYETNEYLSDKQVNIIKRFYCNSTKCTELELELPMRMYYPQELDALLQLNGFSIIHKFGDYSMASFDSSSQKQIIVAAMM